jgi:hypothetical protein
MFSRWRLGKSGEYITKDCIIYYDEDDKQKVELVEREPKDEKNKGVKIRRNYKITNEKKSV